MAVEAARARAPFASDPTASRGRLHPEPPSGTRSAYRRDCDRIIHASAFRRLTYKTQVFVFHEGDHYRTRLTHTLEVAQIARSLARALGLDEDLAEALALAHDLGHPPFGHAGERALDECLADHGGFDHNAQTLRVVTLIERRYPQFDGLNLTWETLEGLIKHNGPLTDRARRPVGRYAARGLPAALPLEAAGSDLMLWSHAGAEAQAAAIADDIAYNAHDIDDGLRAELFSLEDLGGLPTVGETLGDIRTQFHNLDPARLVHELIRRLIGRTIEDVVAESDRRFAAAAPGSADDVRLAGHTLVGFSPAMQAVDAAIKDFLFPRMYRHPRVMRIMAAAQGIVADLFRHFMGAPADMPPEWAHDLGSGDVVGRARRVADFIAGMTDRYALIEHARHFDSTAELV
ncbi:MAG TPA: deoxyguanosinetriphosphate triphosphohydrolase [Xanthobacteraceae bacterium]|jgi:dGTPase|nr:deoxyguanosinetriphosphate triphosphohydrolase [Xanthobacteraceae bacterium]